ncbi:uncharacterized protein C17orf113-like [Ruditapes philippinarum]|uniref:uncharacterized protein C17orf113-like n=1 Tax=Ruditapes philippinarum TaxID=129788 RepID=UPI00295B557A|nr:uncharacterized protein C17orf113-like [Ruditapes philippinarum]
MFRLTCETCEKNTKKCLKSVFTIGTNNFKRSALVRHQKCDDHNVSCNAKKQKPYMTAAVKIVQKKYEPILEAQLRTALYMAKENIANRKFLSLIDLQISNAHIFYNSSVKETTDPDLGNRKPSGILRNHQAVMHMQQYLADVLQEMALIRIKNSPYIGIMVDESLDITTTKKLVMFAKIIHNGELKLEFCANVDIVDGKAETVYKEIINWLGSVGVNVDKVSGFGSDGASVMTGRKAGVGVKLKADNPRIIHIWCAAHRLALTGQLKESLICRMYKKLLLIFTIFMSFQHPGTTKLEN